MPRWNAKEKRWEDNNGNEIKNTSSSNSSGKTYKKWDNSTQQWSDTSSDELEGINDKPARKRWDASVKKWVDYDTYNKNHPKQTKQALNKPNNKASFGTKVGKTALATTNYVGQGSLRGIEQLALNNMMNIGSSEYNPMMQLTAEDLSTGDKLKNIAKLSTAKTLDVLGLTGLDFGLSKKASKYIKSTVKESQDIKSKQQTAQELIAADKTNKLISTLSGDENFNQNVLDKNSLVKSTNLGGQIAETIGEMLPSIAVGNQALSTATMGTQAYGGAISEAYGEGANREQANLYGALNAAVAMSTEWITGGVPGVKGKLGGGLDRFVAKGLGQKTLDEVSSSMAKEILKYGYKILGEGSEEALEEIINPLLKNATYSKGEKVKWEDVFQSAIIGGITGGILDAPESVSNIRQARRANADVNTTKLPKKERKAKQTAESKAINEEVSGTTIDEMLKKQSEIAKERRAKENTVEEINQETNKEAIKEEVKEEIKEETKKTNKEIAEEQIEEIEQDQKTKKEIKKIAEKLGVSEQDVANTPKSVLDKLMSNTNTEVNTTANAEENIEVNKEEPTKIEQETKEEKPKTKTQMYNNVKELYETAIESGNKAIRQQAMEEYQRYKESGGKKTIEGLEENTNINKVEKQETEVKQELKVEEPKIPVKQNIKVNQETEAKKLQKSPLNKQSNVTTTVPTKTAETTKAVNKPTGRTAAQLEFEKMFKMAREEQAIKEEIANGALDDIKKDKSKKTPNKVEEVKKETKTTERTQKVETKKEEVKPLNKKDVETKTKKTVKPSQEEVKVSTANIETRQQFMERTVKNLDRELSQMKQKGSKVYNEFVEGKLRIYDKLLADGGTKIPELEKLRTTDKISTLMNEAGNVIDDMEKVIKKANSTESRDVIKTFSSEQNKLPLDIQFFANKNISVGTELFVDDINQLSNDIMEAAKDISEGEPLNSEILTEYTKPKEDKQLKKAKKKILKNNLIVDWFNQAKPLLDIDNTNNTDAAMQAWTQSGLSRAQGMYQVSTAQTDINDNIIGKSVSEIAEVYDGLTKEGKQIWLTRANLKRDLSFKLNSEKYELDYANNIFPEYSAADIETLLEQIDTQYPKLAKSQEANFEDIQEFYRNSNQTKVDGGLLPETIKVSKQIAKEMMGLSDGYIEGNIKNGEVTVNTVDYLSALNPYYFHSGRVVPIYDSPMTYRENTIGVKPIKGLKEGAEKYAIQPMYDTMAEGAYKDRIALRENQLYQVVGKYNPKIPPKDIVSTNTVGETKIIKGPENTYYIPYFENGQQKAARVTEDMVNALNNGRTKFDEMFESIGLLKGIKEINNIQKQLLTTYKATFSVVNTARDALEASFYTNYSNVEFTKEYANSIKEIMTNDEKWQRFQATGLPQQGIYGFNSEKGLVTRNNASTLERTMNKIDSVASISEMIARYTEYKLALKHSETHAEALREAKSITVDFPQAGKKVKQADRTVTKFLGAAQGGVNKLCDTFITNNINAIKSIHKKATGQELSHREVRNLKKAGRVLARTITLGMLPSLFNNLVYDDDDKEFMSNIPQYIKDQNYIIRVDKENYISIPMARSIGIIDKIGNIMNSKNVKEEDRQHLGDLLNYMENNILPDNLNNANALSTFIQVKDNKDYYGNEIYKSTDTTGKKASAITDYLFKNYGGDIYTVYNYTKSNYKVNKTPIVNKFYRTTEDISSYNSRFYKIRDQYANSTDPLDKLKYSSLNYDYTKYVKPLKDKISMAEEAKSDPKEIKKLYDELIQTYQSIYSQDDTVYDVEAGIIINYRGYKYKLVTEKDKNTGKERTYYKKMRS